MKRNIQKAIEDYQKTFGNKTTTEGAFFVDDANQIIKLSGEGEDFLFNVVFNALEAGFMIGYRKAKDETRKAHK